MPDLITVAKGLASGYQPIGAVIASEKVTRHFDDQVLACGLTYYAHPTACAAAVATLELYDDEKLFDNARRLGPVLRPELDAIAGAVRARSFVRGLGLLAVLEVEAEASAWAALSGELRDAHAVAARRRQARHGDLRAAAVHHRGRAGRGHAKLRRSGCGRVWKEAGMTSEARRHRP